MRGSSPALLPLLDSGPQVDFSVLNPNGPFVLLNPVSKLPAGETHVLVLSFSPRESMLVRPRPSLRPLCTAHLPARPGLRPCLASWAWLSQAGGGGWGGQSGLSSIVLRPGGSRNGASPTELLHGPDPRLL